MTDSEKYAWLAGFMDGDGWFTCAVCERIARKSKRHSITIAPRIGASQIASERGVLDRCVEITGCGAVYLKQEKSNALNSALQSMWTVSKLSDLKMICEALLPFVYLKKRQCEIMLEIVNLRLLDYGSINRYRGEKYPIENTLKCAELGLSLNPESTLGRNRQHNSEKRHWSYWEKRIKDVYSM
jgi:hypothetical protein